MASDTYVEVISEKTVTGYRRDGCVSSAAGIYIYALMVDV